MKDNLPRSKRIRLKYYDYSTCGMYFITICIKNRLELLGKIQDKNNILLTTKGNIVEKELQKIEVLLTNVTIDEYIIMPNHIHLILRIDSLSDLEATGRPMAVPTISTVINQFKGAVSRMAGFNVWQGRLHDRILRNEREYRGAWQYIENNHIQWENDEYFIKE